MVRLFLVGATRAKVPLTVLSFSERRGLVGSGDRSQRIRTYNFPQNRLSDHRINQNFNLDQILAGRLNLVLDALEERVRQERGGGLVAG